MRKSLYEYCVEKNIKYLLDQWDFEKNGDLTPEQVLPGSHKKVWWKCAEGHQWQATVYTRVDGTGCPICTNHMVVPGINDLQTEYPTLAEQWHPEKNGELTPDLVLPGSHKKVWWKCGKGHEWQAQVKSRVGGNECPVCTNRVVSPGENDLGTNHPELAEQWHPIKNEGVTPRDVVAGSDKRIWWKCSKGHEWQAKISSRTGNKSGCPVCAGKVIIPGENDLASSNPYLAKQWHPTKNNDLTPEKVTPGSNRSVWWRCDLGHEWQTTIAKRTLAGVGCPYCAGRRVLVGFNDLATLMPQVAEQWHPTLNDGLTPQMVTRRSHKKVWWQCAEGHIWKTVVYSRTSPRGTGCPVCAGTAKGNYQERYAEALKTE